MHRDRALLHDAYEMHQPPYRCIQHSLRAVGTCFTLIALNCHYPYDPSFHMVSARCDDPHRHARISRRHPPLEPYSLWVLHCISLPVSRIDLFGRCNARFSIYISTLASCIRLFIYNEAHRQAFTATGKRIDQLGQTSQRSKSQALRGARFRRL
jgi:hypothetical protein